MDSSIQQFARNNISKFTLIARKENWQVKQFLLPVSIFKNVYLSVIAISRCESFRYLWVNSELKKNNKIIYYIISIEIKIKNKQNIT